MNFRSILIATVLLLFTFHGTTTFSNAEASTRYPIDSFGGGVSNGLPTNGDYNCIGVGNANGDDHMDIICGGEQNYGSDPRTGLYYFAGNGAGTWTSTTLIGTNSFAGIEVADCDNDGLQEIYAGYQENSNGIGAWEWTGAGFGTGGITSPLTSNGANYMRIANITGGPGLDMAVAAQTGIRYYEGSGSAPISWTEHSTGLKSNGLSTQLDINDINNDGLTDMIVGQYGDGLYIYTQDVSGTSWTDRSASLPTPEQNGRVLGLTTGDVNNDGNIDIILNKRTNPNGLFLLLGNGGGGTGTDFQWTYLNNSWTSRPTGTFYQSHLADIDKDGDLDLLTAKESSGLHIYLGNGSENPGTNFGWTELTGKGLPTLGMFTGSNYVDFDDDGDLDVAGCTYGIGMIVLENNLTLPDVPVANAGVDQTVFLGDTIRLDGRNSTDPQDCPGGDLVGDILSYDWNFTDQPEGSVMTDADLQQSDTIADPSFIPTHSGNYTLSLAVKDPDEHWCVKEDEVTISVIMVNTEPVANAGPDMEVYIGVIVELNGTGSSDAEDLFGSLIFDWNVSAGNPSAVTLSDETEARPTFTAPPVTGDYHFTLVVRDTLDAWSAEDEVEITVVLPPNIRPVADAGTDLTAFSNTTIHLNGSGSEDTDGSIVTWDWNCTTHPVVSILEENSSTPSFVPDRSGEYSFTLTVRDDRGGWANEDEVVVTVIEENEPPFADAGEDFTAYLGEETFMNGSASRDLEGHITAWDWNCTNHPTLTLGNGNSSTPSFIPEALMTYNFTLRVRDDLGLWSANDRVNVTVIERPVNRRPVANAGKDMTVHLNTTVVLNGSNSYDGDGNITEWDWSCPSYCDLVFENETTAHPGFLAGMIGKYEIELIVRDDLGLWSLPDSVIVTVIPEDEEITEPTVNDPPTIALTSPRNGNVISGVSTITWSAGDDDLDPLTFRIELLDTDGKLIKVLAETISSGSRSWKWDTSGEPDGSYMIRITAADGIDETTAVSGGFSLENELSVSRKESGDMLGTFWIVIIILVILIPIIIVLIILRRRGKAGEEEESPEEFHGWAGMESEKVEDGERRDEASGDWARDTWNEDNEVGWFDDGARQLDGVEAAGGVKDDHEGYWDDDEGEQDHDTWDGRRTWDGRYGTGTMLDWDTKVESGGGRYRRDDESYLESDDEHSDDDHDDDYEYEDDYDHDDDDD